MSVNHLAKKSNSWLMPDARDQLYIVSGTRKPVRAKFAPPQQAALNILRRAAPFDPFPESVRVDHPNLNFSYVWQFNSNDVQSTASAN